MKKIIKQKRYDTDRARKLCTWENGQIGGLDYMEETLFQKRTGEFFLYGEGGPMTKYAVTTGNNSWKGGENIFPLTDEAAREWAEAHMDADAFEAIFNPPEEEGDPARRMFTAYVSGRVVEQIKREARARGISQGEVIEEWARMARG